MQKQACALQSPQSARAAERHSRAGRMNGTSGQPVEVATVMVKEVINTVRGCLRGFSTAT